MKRIQMRKSQAEIAGVSGRTLTRWRTRPDWQEAPDGSVDPTWLRRYAKARLTEAVRAQRGPLADENRQLILERIKRL